MASIEEVQSYIISNWNAEHVGEGSLRLEAELGEGRTQMVFATIVGDILAISSPFAKEESITEELALHLSSNTFFGVKVFGGFYVLQHIIFVEDLDASEIDKGLALIASFADQLESTLGNRDNL
mgnify:CR=1 FL=1